MDSKMHGGFQRNLQPGWAGQPDTMVCSEAHRALWTTFSPIKPCRLCCHHFIGEETKAHKSKFLSLYPRWLREC